MTAPPAALGASSLPCGGGFARWYAALGVAGNGSARRIDRAGRPGHAGANTFSMESTEMSATATARIAPANTEEREIRVQLAACYRLMHKYAMDRPHLHPCLGPAAGHGTAISCSTPTGLLFNEITASNLVEVDAEGEVVGDSEWGANWAGYFIHGAALRARANINCALHTHTRAGVAISPARMRGAAGQPARHGLSQSHRLPRLRGLRRRHGGMRPDGRQPRRA